MPRWFRFPESTNLDLKVLQEQLRQKTLVSTLVPQLFLFQSSVYAQ